MISRAFAAAVVFALAGPGATCQTRRPDVTGSGDERIDEPAAKEQGPADAGSCTADGAGNVVLIDARSASPLSCVLVTISREQVGCDDDQPCEAMVLYRGHTDAAGRAPVNADPAADALSAVAEGYVPSYRSAAAAKGPAEIEMVPAEGFLLKFLDAEGNYLSRLAVTFRQGSGVIAQLRTNELADVFFASRTPFSGEPVVVEAEGYPPVKVSSSSDLGSDGHTVVLKR